jgi:hypothetical protein
MMQSVNSFGVRDEKSLGFGRFSNCFSWLLATPT